MSEGSGGGGQGVLRFSDATPTSSVGDGGSHPPSGVPSGVPPPTTTISTIALQSGTTRIVIALLQSRDWIQLKLLETSPALTQLGSNLIDAADLQRAHDEVLLQLQSKQSPVEELLRQADQLISTQNPRAEVYAAMAESLGQAWRDVNKLLEDRKVLLDLNVQYHSAAERSIDRMLALEKASVDPHFPGDADSAKRLLTKLHDLKRAMLEAFMVALQEGRSLLEKLQEFENLGTLDSRPGQTRAEAQLAISQVQHWLEALHDRRRALDGSWSRRKNQLEQALALALLATELEALDATLKVRHEGLARSDQLGDSSSSAELLLHEHNKLIPEAKELQEKGLRVTRATDRLISEESGSQTSESRKAQLGMQAYSVLSSCSEYLHLIDQRAELLTQTINFFRQAQAALTKLDQLEVQLATCDTPAGGELHSQVMKTLEEITTQPLQQGHALLATADACGTQGTEGVRRTVEEIENRKISLSERCTARQQESLLVTQAITAFMERYNQLYSWLVGVGEAFVQGHQDMGSVLAMAQDFLDLHRQLLRDLKVKGTELESLEGSVPALLHHLSPEQRSDVESKMAGLRSQWEHLRTIVNSRIELSERYTKFHSLAVRLANQYDSADVAMRSAPCDTQAPQEELWLACQQQLLQLQTSGQHFLQDTAQEDNDPYLDLKRARLCVETLLEHFKSRQFSLSDLWTIWQTKVITIRETTVQWTRITMESTRTVEWVSRLDAQFYPLLSADETTARGVLRALEEQQARVLPEAKRAQTEIELRLRAVESLQVQGEALSQRDQLVSQLLGLNQRFSVLVTEYQLLLQMLAAFFKNVAELEKTTESLQCEYRGTVLPPDPVAVERMLKEHHASRHAIAELFRFNCVEAEQAAARVRQQEPAAAADNDEEVIRRTLRDRQTAWEKSWEDRRAQLEQHLQRCQFDADLHQLNQQLGDLATQLGRVKGQFGESLATARANAQAFVNFERTIELLERRVTVFVSTAENLLAAEHMSSSHVQRELERLQARWAALRGQVTEAKRLIELSVQYFTLVEEAEEWFREGSRLLVTIARKSTGVKTPEEATQLLSEVELFLRPGEAKQNDRITKISSLAFQLYGEERSRQVTTVLTENHEMFESFNVITVELTTLVQNLMVSQEERHRYKQEMLEADASLVAARAEADVARAAAAAAEEVRRAAESAAKAFQQVPQIIKQATPPPAPKPEPPPTVLVVEPQPPLKKVKHEEVLQMLHEEILLVPVFIEALQDAVIQEGDKFTFECKVCGEPYPEVEWFKDGMSIQNNPDYHTSYIDGVCTLKIEETFSEDSAKFTCKAINKAGKAETHATLSVKEPGPQLTPPQVLKGLVDATVRERSKHVFECSVHGYPLPTVQWFKDGTCIDSSPDYVTTFNNGECKLHLDEVFLEDQANFSCQASSRLGTCQTQARLTVTPLVPSQTPAFSKPLTNIMARTGEKIKLECEVTGMPEPKISWTHDGKSVKETREVKILSEKLKSTLSITEAFPKDAGVYTAKAKNLAGAATSSCNVSVKGRLPTETSDSEMASDIEAVKPVIQMQLKDTRVDEGTPVKLDSIITGQPEPEVIWYHNGRPVKESKEVQLLFKGDRCTLIIKEALSEESGEYRIVAVNSAGEASSACQLTVDAPSMTTPEPEILGVAPRFSKLLSDILTPEGETTKFECIVEGNPVPTITWLLNNHPVPPSDRIEMFYDEENGIVRLSLTNTMPIDKGVYTAKASNSLGEAKCFATLIVRSHQDIPEVQRQKYEAPYFIEKLTDKTVIEGDSARFECIVQGKPAPKVRWLYNDVPVSGHNFLSSTSGQRQVLTVQEASSNLSGTITCVAENEAGKATSRANILVEAMLSGVPSDLTMDITDTNDIQHSESFSTRRAVFMQTTSSSSSSIQGGSSGGLERHSFTSQSQHAMQQVGDQPPQQMQSQRTEAVHQVNQESPVVHQQSSLVVSRGSPVPQIKPVKQRKAVPPRFISPLNGKIVDQGADVLLEGIVDGHPVPSVTWLKNGQEIPSTCEPHYEHGKATLQLRDVGVPDAGRYTCRAENEAGTASSTADLVVKKTIFPPVFGRRLQAQMVRIGERARLEVEVTGTPEPEITWRKDGLPVTAVPGVAVKSQGQCHSLVIDKATTSHTGQYSVCAVNSGGQAQSIADFAVIDAAPQITLEVTRMVFEDVEEQNKREAAKFQPLLQTIIPQGTSSTTSEFYSTSKSEFSSKTEKTSINGREIIIPITQEKNGGLLKSQDPSDLLARIKVEPLKEKFIPIEFEKSNDDTFKKKSEVLMDVQHQHIPTKFVPPVENTLLESKQIHSSSVTTSIEKKYLSHNVQFDDIHLEPGQAPEMCFSTLPEGTKIQEDISERVKRFEEEMNARESIEAPAGAVRILPIRIEKGNEPPLPRGISEYLEPSPILKEKQKNVTFASPSPILPSQPSVEKTREVVEEVIVASSAQKTGSDWTIRPNSPAKMLVSGTKTPSAEGLAMEKLWAPVRPASPLDKSRPKLHSPVSIDRSSSPRISAEARAMEKLWTPRPTTPVERIQSPKPRLEPAWTERCASPRPSTEGLAMEKLWAAKRSSEYQETVNHFTREAPEPERKRANQPPRPLSVPCVIDRPISPRPSSQGVAMDKMWAHSQDTTVKKRWPPPSMQDDAMKPSMPWRNKETAVPPQAMSNSDFVNINTTVKNEHQMQKSETQTSTMNEITTETVLEEQSPLYVQPPKPTFQPIQPAPLPFDPPKQPTQYYIAQTEKVLHKEAPVPDEVTITSDSKSEFKTSYTSSSTSKNTSTQEETKQQRVPSPTVVEERGLTPSELKKLWSQRVTEQALPPPKPVKHPRKELPFKPKVEILRGISLEELGLKPGPPPEMGFVEACSERRQSKVSETLELELDKEPTRHLVGAVRTFPLGAKATPASPKTVKPPSPMPVPSYSTANQRPYTPSGLDKILEPFPKLEPFPFKPEPETPRTSKGPPPPKPSRFVKGEFAESDYESDFESVRIPVKWRPYESDTEELTYRKVKAPSLNARAQRSKSIDPVPMPPMVFDKPLSFDGYPTQSQVSSKHGISSSVSQQTSSSRQTTSSTQVTRVTTVEQRSSSSVTGSKHGDEVIGKISPPTQKKSNSPLVVDLSASTESGYWADTDEPRRHQKKLAGMGDIKPGPPPISFPNPCEAHEEKKQPLSPQHNKTNHPHKPHKKLTPTAVFKTDAPGKEPPTDLAGEVGKSKHTEDSPLEPFPYKPSPPSKPHAKVPPPPSPSKFIKCDFKESELSIDLDGQRILPLWRPAQASDTDDLIQYRTVRPPSTPTLQMRPPSSLEETPLPPTQFETPPPLSDGPLRPKFEPIEKISNQIIDISNLDIENLHVLKPTALLANPVLQPGSPPRIMYMQPPHDGSFAQYQNGTEMNGSEPKFNPINQFPSSTHMETSKKVHMSESTEYSRRFVTMEHTTRVIQFGEKQVETQLEPFPFTPDSETPKPKVHVPPPPTPTKFTRGEFRESDYESDIETVKIKPKWNPNDSDTDDPTYRKVNAPTMSPKSQRKQGREPTPPSVFDTNPPTELEQQRLQRIDQMRRRFSEDKDLATAAASTTKTTQIASEQMSEMTETFKSKAQQFMSELQSTKARESPPKQDDPSVYREETRQSEFGSKHIDPDTGLIYFKYDFGYEFGLILPGEGSGKPTQKKVHGKKEEGAIDFPIIHERSEPKCQKPKRVKWNSESELSEVEASANHRPSRPVIPPIASWEPSPVSSPTPVWGKVGDGGPGSRRPGQGRGSTPTPPSTPSTPGSTHGTSHLPGQLRKSPSFITPLRDIAAVAGTSARFECIVQAEPPPSIMWSKDGRIIEHGHDRHMQYRNGVCRLTIPQAFPEDAGSYTCTATNSAGSSSSSATLQVPGETRRGRFVTS